MLKSKEKGDLAVASAIHYFMTNGYEVCLPIGDKKDYDIIVEQDNNLYKVQIKFAGIYSRNGQCKVGLRITGGNQSYNTAKKYGNAAFDFLYVYTEKKQIFLLPWNKVMARNEISIEHMKYQRYNVSSLQS